jgi:MOSC domain-containing protein YiiM
MKLISVSVGMPQIVQTSEEGFITTAIFKQPVAGKVKVGQLNLEGDAQADLRVHGGWSKAVYAYPVEHYDYWRTEFPEKKLEDAQFGENLAIQGLLETELCIGDRLRIGSAEFIVTEPRMPCSKLGIRFGRKDIIRRFLQSRRSGFYLAVTQTGELEAGDEIELISRDENKVSVTDIVRVWVEDKNDVETMKRALKIESLPESWKEPFRERIAGQMS